MELSGSQRKHLRGLAHDFKPIVQVGKNGLTDSLFNAVNHALEIHELIKVKFVDFKEDRKELTLEIEKKTDSHLVGLIGNIGIYYKQNQDPKKRKIKI